MSSSTFKKEMLDADSDDSKSESPPRPENDDKKPRVRWSDTSSTTNDPSSATATVSTAVERHPTPRSGIPTLAAAAAAAAPRVPMKEKKPRRAGFREQFLQRLRVMLDRESQNDSTTVQWSTDGNSFIITDQNLFEEHIIPTYFDNPIVFASFLSKIYRWGFNRVSSRQAGRYEFRSPSFKRLHPDNAGLAACTAAKTSSNNGGGARIQVKQQAIQTQAFSSSLQQVIAQTNQLLAPYPLQEANAIIALLSNMQAQLRSQQPSVPSHQRPLNQVNQPNNTAANSILQGFLSSNQQPLLIPQSTPSQQLPVLNQSTTDPLIMNLILQPFQQTHHPNLTLNLLNAALTILAGSQAPSSAHLMGRSSPSSQINTVQTLMSLYGMSSHQPTLPNTIASAAMSRLNNMAVPTLLTLLQRVVDEDVQRSAQVVAIQNTIMTAIGRIFGQHGIPDSIIVTTKQTLGSSDNDTSQPQQVGTPPASNLTQAESIAAILQAAGRRDEAAGQLEEDANAQNGDSDNSVNEDGNDSNEDYEGSPLSPRKRKSPDDDQYDADDDSWHVRLRPRNKSRKLK